MTDDAGGSQPENVDQGRRASFERVATIKTNTAGARLVGTGRGSSCQSLKIATLDFMFDTALPLASMLSLTFWIEASSAPVLSLFSPSAAEI